MCRVDAVYWDMTVHAVRSGACMLVDPWVNNNNGGCIRLFASTAHSTSVCVGGGVGGGGRGSYIAYIYMMSTVPE